ncbi:MAG: serine hydrolase domain-containing protein [Bacteroidota bacterium]
MKNQKRIIKIFVVVALIGVFIPSAFSQAKNEKRSLKSINGKKIMEQDLEDFLLHQIDSLTIPGLSFAYVNDGKVVFSKNFGVANLETQESVTDSSLFDAASISKTVFSFFVMQMVDKGLLNLDSPLYIYLENPDIAYDERYKKITARMALSHTTGFPNWRYLTENGYDPTAKLRIDFEPGTRYQYSGEGYQYLAQVMAHLLQTDMNGLQTIIKKTTFKPLKMGESSFVWNDYLEKNRVVGHIKGRTDAGYSANSKDPDFNAAASLQTNAISYGNFLSALMSGKLLSATIQKEMVSIQSERPATKSRPGVKYGFGIVIEPTFNGTNYGHSGDNNSATSQFLFNDKHKSGYVFFTNMEYTRKRIFDVNLKKFLLQKDQ